MTNHTLISKAALESFEDEIFPAFLNPALERIHACDANCISIDSAAIRSRFGYTRNMGDIDLFFPDSSPDYILKIARRLEEDVTGKLIIANEAGFFRLKYSSFTKEPVLNPNLFLIDFHVGAIFHNNEPILPSGTLLPAEKNWAYLPSISGRHKAPLPMPSMEELLRFKCARLIGHDDIDILAFLLSEKFEYPFGRSQNDDVRQAFRHIALNFPTVATRFSAYHFLPLNEQQLNKIADTLKFVCGIRPTDKAINAYRPDIAAELLNSSEAIAQMLSQGDRQGAQRIAVIAAEKSRPIDYIASEQFRTASIILESNFHGSHGRDILKRTIASITNLINIGTKIDDRLGLYYGEIREYYNIALMCDEGKTANIEATFQEKKDLWKLSDDAIHVACYLACAAYLIEKNIESRHVGGWPTQLIKTVLNDIIDCIRPRHSNDSSFSDLIEAASNCLNDVAAAIRIRRSGAWLGPNCLENINHLRGRSGSFLCVTRVLESLVRLTSR
jgi:hypothetical protein